MTAHVRTIFVWVLRASNTVNDKHATRAMMTRLRVK